ncbi:MAG: CDP-glycerol glycerophosphotransferase family protein [Candidatus Borkfalkiaceae bacterium]|nr:CDP-glycerol glycerophosphotransferase family protein [Christensenellaceae bacterium]
MKKTITFKKILLKLYFRTKAVILIYFFYIVALFKKKSDYWVICERGVDARDNGYAFYKYLKKEHPEQIIYYIIDKKSADYKKVAEDAVQYGSLKNYLIIANASKIISTHIGTFVPHIGAKTTNLCRLNKKFYWLQHGIIKNSVGVNWYDKPAKKVFCSTVTEYNFIKEKGEFPDSVLKCTGLARYDDLISPVAGKKQILVMPTWRSYILTEKKFLHSKYFEEWQKLLNDKRLSAFLENNNLNLIFYPHYECQRFLKYFSFSSARIISGSFDSYDVQSLIKESSIMITDYSSVSFDFSYMRKPMIYFQFDKYDFYNKHYGKGYFDDDTMGFGDICESVDEVIKSIEKIKDNDFCLEQKYRERINEFFIYNDILNCSRIYNEVVKD